MKSIFISGALLFICFSSNMIAHKDIPMLIHADSLNHTEQTIDSKAFWSEQTLPIIPQENHLSLKFLAIACLWGTCFKLADQMDRDNLEASKRPFSGIISAKGCIMLTSLAAGTALLVKILRTYSVFVDFKSRKYFRPDLWKMRSLAHTFAQDLEKLGMEKTASLQLACFLFYESDSFGAKQVVEMRLKEYAIKQSWITDITNTFFGKTDTKHHLFFSKEQSVKNMMLLYGISQNVAIYLIDVYYQLVYESEKLSPIGKKLILTELQNKFPNNPVLTLFPI